MSKDTRITEWAIARGYIKADDYVTLGELRILAAMFREELRVNQIQELTDSFLGTLPAIPRELQLTNASAD